MPAVVTGSAIGAVYLLAAAFFFLELTNAVLWTLPIDIAGLYAGTAGGIMNTGFGVAGMISPVVFGVLIQRTGRYELPFYISAGLLLVGAFCAMGIDPTLKVRRNVSHEDSGDELTMRVRSPLAPCSGRRLRASICARSMPRHLRGDPSRVARPSGAARSGTDADRRRSGGVQPPVRRLDEAPVQETGRRFVEGHPEIYVVSNVVQDGVAIGSLGSGEAVWHTDMSYLADPPKASVLYALEVPPHGRRHQLLLDVCRLGSAARPRCDVASKGCA